MTIEIITTEDLDNFRKVLLTDFTNILVKNAASSEKPLRSSEVRKLLAISNGTLQSLRDKKILSYSKIGNILFYDKQEILKLIRENKYI